VLERTDAVNDHGSLIDLLDHSAKLYSEAPALVPTRRSPGASFTYASLRDAARRGAASLAARGLDQGDRVLLALESQPEWGAAFFSILEAGLVAVPLPASTPPEALLAAAGHVGARAILSGTATQTIAAGLEDAVSLSTTELFAAEPIRADAALGSELAVLAFTSGSTSRPRVVELTHANLLADLDSLLRVRSANPGDAFLSMLPPAHLFELVAGLLGPLASGARVVYPGTLLPSRIVEAMREEEITHAMAVPALVDALFEETLEELADSGVISAGAREHTPSAAAARIEELDALELQGRRAGLRERIGRSFRYLVVGGAALEPLWARMLTPLGIPVECGYGLTEAGPIVSVGYASECPVGSVGRPLPGIDVRVDEQGEILVRGGNVMRGYFGDPTTTARTLVDGWLRTGDTGRLSADGFLFVTGRIKEAMVTAAGETIYPDEIEPCYENALFEELCVAPMPGPDGNDRPTLFVVSNTEDDGELENLFIELRASAPPRCRVERMIRVPGPLPRTVSGKVRRRHLAEQRARAEGRS
jgi:long-chain acyl-CoA synthetase